MFQALLTTLFFSASAIFGNRSAKILGGIGANFYRIILAAIFLGVWAHLGGQGVKGAAFRYFFISGVIGFGIGDVALYQALPRIGSRLSIMMVHCLAAPFAAVLEWAWLGTTLTLLQIFCGFVILLGVAIALAPGNHLKVSREVMLAGVVAAFIAGITQGLSSVISRKAYMVAQQAGEDIHGMSAGVTAAYQRIIGGVIIATAFFLFFRWRAQARGEPAFARETKGAAKWVVLNGLAGPALGVVCYQWALATTPTGIVMPIVALSPLVIIPFAKVFEHEKPTPHSLLGGVIAVIGVVGLRLGR